MQILRNFLLDALKKPKNHRLSDNGDEVLDPTPLALPLDHEIPESLEDKIKRLVASERFAQAVANQGYETFEEADDFDVGDDFEAEPQSPWELTADQESFRRDPPKRQAPKAQKAAPPEQKKPEAKDEPISTENNDQ